MSILFGDALITDAAMLASKISLIGKFSVMTEFAAFAIFLKVARGRKYKAFSAADRLALS